MKKKILIGCEYSGIVRSAFETAGWNAISCDLLPTEIPGPHYQGNIFDIVNDGFDAMIAFPPCTYLSSAGLHLCNIERHGKKAIDRIKNRNKAIEFFLDLYSVDIKHICLENPLGHISANILNPSQIVHPYYFGDREMKRTAFWLKNLPPLIHSETATLFEQRTHTEKPEPYETTIQKKTGKTKNRYFTDAIGHGNFLNAKNKAKFWPSIAEQMALQWTDYIMQADRKINLEVCDATNLSDRKQFA